MFEQKQPNHIHQDFSKSDEAARWVISKYQSPFQTVINYLVTPMIINFIFNRNIQTWPCDSQADNFMFTPMRAPSNVQFKKRLMVNRSAQYKMIKTSKLSFLALSVLFNHLGVDSMLDFTRGDAYFFQRYIYLELINSISFDF